MCVKIDVVRMAAMLMALNEGTTKHAKRWP